MEDVNMNILSQANEKSNSFHPHQQIKKNIQHTTVEDSKPPLGGFTKDTEKVREEIQEVRQKKLYRLRAAQDMWHSGSAYSLNG